MTAKEYGEFIVKKMALLIIWITFNCCLGNGFVGT